jgi:cytochrome d ubiquinol oxidase subunit I
MVAFGTLLSAFWILSANSWMHTPAGFELRDGIFYPVDWWKIVFNPSFPYRLVHMVLASYLTTAFVILGVGAWLRLKGTAHEAARVMLIMGVAFVSIVTPLQIVAGDFHGLNTLEHQPAKIAAMEAHWETEEGAALALFAWPDAQDETNHFEIAVPHMASLILMHEWNGKLVGLKDFAPSERPPVAPIFFSFRIMVGLGILMLIAGIMGLWLAFRGRLFESRAYHRYLVAMIPSGFLAVLAGWITTEIGRQPYTVYGLLRTSDSVSPVSGPSVLATLITFVIVYGIIFGAGLYYILRIIRTGPGAAPEPPVPDPYATPARPLSYPDKPAGEQS